MTSQKKKTKKRAGASGPAARDRMPDRTRTALVVAGVSLALIVVAVRLYRSLPRGGWRGSVAASAPAARFVGRAECARCHAREDSLWRGSHHDRAMQAANEQTVLGDFNGARFTHFGVTSTFTKRGGKYFARTDGPDGALHDYEIAFTFGVYPLQQYLIAFPGGRYQALNVVWDARSKAEGGQKWFHLYPKEAVPHDDVLHWTGAYQNWNFMCAECHSTNVVKGYDPKTGEYHTTFSEINVSCEACHGPGSRHTEWAAAVAAGKIEKGARDHGLVVDLRDTVAAAWIIDTATGLPRRSSPRATRAEVEMCARCHARRSVLTEAFAAGLPLADTHRPALLTDPLYFADGQIRDEVYEYGSFRQSRMYHRGVTCSDCHDPHRAGIARPVDAACGKCHPPANFAAPSHTHHKPDTPASSCVRCHMPTRDYMVVHARHDHSIRIPRPDLTVSLGTPNACATCHADRSAAWAAAASAKWWTKRAGEPQYGQTLDAGRRAARGSAELLATLAGDTTMPSIVRATAIELLGRRLTPPTLSAVRRSLYDPDPLVRVAGVDASGSQPAEERVKFVAPLLTDSIRLVRIDAARSLAGAPPSLFDSAQKTAFVHALAEYRAEQAVNADRAEAHLSLGAFFAETGQNDSAATEYAAAMRMNPSLLATYVNLADLYRQQGRDADAERVLRQGLALAPKGAGAEMQYALGLTYVRQQRYTDAVGPFTTASALSPDVARYALLRALTLQKLGRVEEAKDVLARALGRHPDDRELAQAYAALVRPPTSP